MEQRRIITIVVAVVIIVCLCLASVSLMHTDDDEKKMIELPLVRQSTEYTCGVACVQSILYYNGIDYREDLLAAELGSTYESGTSIDMIMSFLDNVTWETGYWLGLGERFEDGIGADYRTNITIDELMKEIDSGHPVLCVIQAWEGTPDNDYVDEWDCGHYVIAVGYDSENIYFMDPSTTGNYASIEKSYFLSRWHDMYIDEDGVSEKLMHPGIVITNPNPVYDSSRTLPLQ